MLPEFGGLNNICRVLDLDNQREDINTRGSTVWELPQCVQTSHDYSDSERIRGVWGKFHRKKIDLQTDRKLYYLKAIVRCTDKVINHLYSSGYRSHIHERTTLMSSQTTLMSSRTILMVISDHT